jgi:hypothetical protein
MDLKKAKENWFSIPCDKREEIHQAYKAKMKEILRHYMDDLSDWLDDPESKETISEFIDTWVETCFRPDI